MKFSLEILITIFVLGFLYSCEQPSNIEFIRDNKADPKGIYFGMKIINPLENEIIKDSCKVEIAPTYISTQHNLKELSVFVNDSLLTTSYKIPFTCNIDTSILLYGYNNVKCIAYSTDSREISDSVQLTFLELDLELKDLSWNHDNIILEWESKVGNYFLHYTILVANNIQMLNAESISIISDAKVKSFTTNKNPYERLFFQVVITDKLGFTKKSNVQSILRRLVNTAHIDNGGIACNVAINYENFIFLANGKDGLRVYTYIDSLFTNTAHSANIYESYRANDVVIDINNNIFLATGRGLRAYTYNGSMLNNTANLNITYNGTTTALDVDLKGDIFVATGLDGLHIYSFDGKSFRPTNHYFYGNTIDVTVKNATIFTANYGGGVYAFSYSDSSLVKTADINNGGLAYSVAMGPDGTIYLASDGIGLLAYKYNGLTLTKVANIKNSSITYNVGIYVDLDGTIYLANGKDGLRVYTYNGFSFTNVAHIDNGGEAHGVAIGTDGTIYLANGSDGLRAYKWAISK